MGKVLLQRMEFRPGASWSLGEQFVLRFTSTGNLELWNARSDEIVWQTGTYAEKLVMQGDGNLVVYAAQEEPVWASGTHGNPDALLCLGDDGSMAIVSSDMARTLWSRNRDEPTESDLGVSAESSGHVSASGDGLSADTYRKQMAALQPVVQTRR